MAIKDPCVALIKCRLQTPHLYEPYTDKYGKTMYSCILRVYDKAEWAKIEAGKRAACQKKFGVDADKKLKKINGNPNCCLLREPDDDDSYKFMKATRKPEDGCPKLIDRAKNGVPQSAGLFVSGAEVFALVSFWAYDNQSTGVGATVLGLQWVKEGEPFGGAPIASDDDFDALDDTGDEVDSYFYTALARASSSPP